MRIITVSHTTNLLNEFTGADKLQNVNDSKNHELPLAQIKKILKARMLNKFFGPYPPFYHSFSLPRMVDS